MTFNIIIVNNIYFNLSCRVPLSLPDFISALLKLNPAHSKDASINHESEGIRHITLECCYVEMYPIWESISSFKNASDFGNIRGMSSINFEE